MVPVIGELADVASAGISLLRGDYVGAALSMGSAIPFVGNIIGPLKIARKGLTTPTKFFSNKTYKQVEKALTKKFGEPRDGGKYNKSFFNNKTKRTYNLHKDPSHRGGKPHVDIRKRELPTDYYKDKPFYLKDK